MVKAWLKRQPKVKAIVLWVMRILSPVLNIVTLAAIPKYFVFFSDWAQFKRAGGKAAILDFYPCLFDKTSTTGIDSHYFHQAIWALKKILVSGVQNHVDVGSDVRFVGILTAITHVSFVDIRPLKLSLERYTAIRGSILDIPFDDNSVISLSSMHVVEHIGLGRYGGPIDPEGSNNACKELIRVLAPKGRLYVSMPIGRTRVQFNGQRVFDVADIIQMFNGLQLVELSVIDEYGLLKERVNPHEVRIGEEAGNDYGLGMFVFEKPNGGCES